MKSACPGIPKPSSLRGGPEPTVANNGEVVEIFLHPSEVASGDIIPTKDKPRIPGGARRLLSNRLLAQLSWIMPPAASSIHFSGAGMELMSISGPSLCPIYVNCRGVDRSA